MRLKDKVALVTGGSRGFGASIVRLFHREGASVVIADVRDEEGQALAASLGSRARYQHLDVTRETEWLSAISAAEKTFGPLRILVNNAGIFRTKPLVETSLDDYQLTVGINQTGTFLGIRHGVPAMRAAGGGSIINIASTAGIEGVSYALPYTASKHAVIGMTRAAALEIAAYGIRINALCPGGMLTPLIAESYQVPLDSLVGMDMPTAPMRRMGTPDEIAGTVLFLASDEASYTTGSVFTADGGLTAGIYSPPSL
jgi:3alpha(or 20beta)-hydroxysteroid dehydrogenase